MPEITKRTPKKINIDPKKVLPVVLIVMILAVSFVIRKPSFVQEHWKGDQSHYLALALKLSLKGLDGYNLREIAIKRYNLSPKATLVFPDHSLIGQDGDIIGVLKHVGYDYYDEPLHMRAPLFSYLLWFSHSMFTKMGHPFVVLSKNEEPQMTKQLRKIITGAQFWAVIVPIAFHLATLVVVFFIGLKFISLRAGSYAAFLMTTNSTGILTSYRLWSEESLTFFMTLSLLMFFYFYERKNRIGVFAAGLAAGLAILSKQTAGLALIIVWIYIFLMTGRENWNYKTLYKKIADMNLVIFTLGAALVSAFWFLKVVQVYGDPLHLPLEAMSNAIDKDTSGWLLMIKQRYHPIIFFSILPIGLSPLFGLVYFTFLRFRLEVIDAWKRRPQNSIVVFLWVWLLVWWTSLARPWAIFGNGPNQEHRYLYPAYPAIVLLVAMLLDQLRGRLCVKIQHTRIMEGIFIVLLILNAIWSVPIGFDAAITNRVHL